MLNKIKKHLEIANKSYFEHMFFAMKIGLKCLWSFVTAFVHAINPAWFEYTTSKRIKRMNDLFSENIELIFSNRQIVIGKAEYYLLRPRLLLSGAAYLGHFHYTLGALFESIENGTNIYFENLGGFKKLHLICLSGSPFSGRKSTLFWSDETHKFVHSREININVPVSLSALYEFRKMGDIPYKVDFADRAMEQLLNEINGIG